MATKRFVGRRFERMDLARAAEEMRATVRSTVLVNSSKTTRGRHEGTEARRHEEEGEEGKSSPSRFSSQGFGEWKTSPSRLASSSGLTWSKARASSARNFWPVESTA